MIASKYSICNTENNRNLNYVYCLNLAPMEKALFLAPMEYSPNRKGITMPMKHTPMVLEIYAPREKAWFYKRFFFEVVMVMVKEKRKYNKKIQCQ